ncbi:unnamed protein product [Rangifer tarandus platyrhynchus]|uniref:Uncharacterized protein n=1 Tax=Rangifer tarandus platyrhynchus TaxID=3082113 RepID=A0AC59ZVN5_RANTA
MGAGPGQPAPHRGARSSPSTPIRGPGPSALRTPPILRALCPEASSILYHQKLERVRQLAPSNQPSVQFSSEKAHTLSAGEGRPRNLSQMPGRAERALLKPTDCVFMPVPKTFGDTGRPPEARHSHSGDGRGPTRDTITSLG